MALTALGDLPNVVRRLVVYSGSEKLATPEGIEIWPIEELSAALENDRLWP